MMNERDIFLEAIAIEDPGERAKFIDKLCRDDSKLRNNVESLLRSHDNLGDFLEVAPSMAAGPESRESPRPLTTDVDLLLASSPNDTAEPFEGPTITSAIESASTISKPNLGHYEVLNVVGRGGMGLVLRAVDTKLNRVVALKVMSAEFAVNPTARQRFLREARAAAAVKHPHVITIYAVEDTGDVPYLVMEFVDGQSLAQKIERCGALTLPEILRISTQIAVGLAAAHREAIVHRDVKPANILLERGDERVRITDFGLARAVADVAITRSGEVTGTPQFMSPEQALGEPADQRSDLFSLGSVIYAMCTGSSPFRADSIVASLRRVCDDRPAPIREVNPAIPSWLVSVIDRLLEKKPSDRFQSAAEVANVLGKHLHELESDPERLHGSSSAVQPAEPCTDPRIKRNSGLSRSMRIGLFALMALVLAAVFVIETSHGEFVLRTDDPHVAAMLGEHGSIVVEDRLTNQRYTLKRGTNRLPSGNYELTVSTPEGLELDTPQFRIRRWGGAVVATAVVRASLPADARKSSIALENWALEFDGVNSHAVIPSLLRDDASPFTIEAWVRPAGQWIDAEKAVEVGAKALLVIGGKARCQLCAWPTHWFAFDQTLAADRDIGTRQSSPLEPNRWVHLALVRDNSETSLYVGGAPVARMTAERQAGRDKYLLQESWLGGHRRFDIAVGPRESDPVGHCFPGQIDEVRISNGARYREKFTPLPRFETDHETLALYHLDDGSGDTFKDSSGNQHHGQIRGARWVTRAEQDAVRPPTLAEVDVVRPPNEIRDRANLELALDRHSYVIMDSLKLDSSSPHTLEAFVTPQEVAPAQNLHVMGAPAFTSLFINDQGSHWCFGLTRSPGFQFLLSPTAVEAGRRVHLGAVRTGRHMSLFLDGRLVDSAREHQTPLAHPRLPFSLNWSRPDLCLVGRVDEIRISTVARYDQDFTPPWESFQPDEHTLALYHCDEGSGTLLTDSSGHDHHGKIVGATWVAVPKVTDGDRPAAEQVDAVESVTVKLASSDWRWTEPVNVGAPVNSAGYEAGPTVSADGLILMFHAARLPSQPFQLWQARRNSVDEPFGEPELLDAVVNGDFTNTDPSLSPDGRILVFCSNRPSEHGQHDLWMSTRRSADDRWGAPVTLGVDVNSSFNEWEPELSSDGLVVIFNSDRDSEFGGTDLWISRRESCDQPFGLAENIGPSVNGPDHEGGAALSSDGLTIIFHRNAAGGITLWRATRASVDAQFRSATPLWSSDFAGGHAMSPSLSLSGNQLVFAMVREDGYGERDIWVSRRVPIQASPSIRPAP